MESIPTPVEMMLARLVRALASALLRPGAMLVVLLAVWAPPPAGAQDGDADRPTIALVLSGGGAKGAAHVGVIEILEDLRVPVDMVVGTSMGAIVGGMYAAGYSPEDMARMLEETDWRSIFNDRPSLPEQSYRQKEAQEEFGYLEVGLGADGFEFPSGFITGQRLGFRLKSLLLHTADINDFDELYVPFRAVAADLRTGEAVVLKEGSLVEAMRASMSVPGVFAPIETEEGLLVDGGVINNFPVNVARELGADVVIAVLASSREETDAGPRDDIPSVLDVSFQVIDLVTRKNVEAQYALLDEDTVFIEVDTSPYTAASFTRSAEIVARGEAAARAAVDELVRHRVSQDEYARFLADQRYVGGIPRVRVDRIEIRSSERVAPERIRARMRTEEGDLLDLEVLERDIERIYGLGYFRTVDFDLRAEGGETVLAVIADDKPWGPNYLRFGLNLREDFMGGGSYSAGAQYAMTQLNPRGGEFRLSAQIGRTLGIVTDFHQPLDRRNRFFIEPSVAAQQSVSDVYEEGRRTAQYQVRLADGVTYLGANLGTRVEARLGLGATYGTAGPLIGGEELEDDDFRQVGHRGALGYDSLDSASFPRHGWNVSLSWLVNRKAIGSDLNTEQVNLLAFNAVSHRRHTLLLSTQANGTWADELVFPFGPSLGGFLRFTGYRPGELTGQYLAQGGAYYYYQLFDIPAALGRSVYIGAGLETGSVWNDLAAAVPGDLLFGGTAYVGVDTNVGPLYIAYGIAQGSPRRGNFYLILGRPF
ncbi:MAG: patatin-like phospholipase family protein [Spirochaetaceae bacterium]